MKLSDTAIRNAKAKEKSYKLFDGGGMYLLVRPDGSRYWRLDYRFNGKYSTLALGVYPTVSLAEARKRRVDVKEKLACGIDPGEQRKQDRMAAQLSAATTFQSVSEEWLAKLEREGRAEATMKKNRWLLGLAYPFIGKRPVSAITSPELLLALQKIEADGRYETASRVRSICGTVFRYAIATGRAASDPSLALRGALTTPQVTHRAAILDPAGVGGLLRAIDGFMGQPTTHAALRLAPHVFLRPGELRQGEWAEIDFNTAVWTVPASKTKMRRPHKVPLSRQALTILRDIHNITGTGRYIFPSIRTHSRPISDNTVNAALRRLPLNPSTISNTLDTLAQPLLADTEISDRGDGFVGHRQRLPRIA